MYAIAGASLLHGAGLWTSSAQEAGSVAAREAKWLRQMVHLHRLPEDGWAPFYRRRKAAARALIHGMAMEQWKATRQTPATDAQIAAMETFIAGKTGVEL